MSEAGMLTVKHVEKSGHQSIVQATGVSYRPGDIDNCTEVIAFGVPNPISDGCNRYVDGRVYVMNEAGATVGSYDLN